MIFLLFIWRRKFNVSVYLRTMFIWEFIKKCYRSVDAETSPASAPEDEHDHDHEIRCTAIGLFGFFLSILLIFCGLVVLVRLWIFQQIYYHIFVFTTLTIGIIFNVASINLTLFEGVVRNWKLQKFQKNSVNKFLFLDKSLCETFRNWHSCDFVLEHHRNRLASFYRWFLQRIRFPRGHFLCKWLLRWRSKKLKSSRPSVRSPIHTQRYHFWTWRLYSCIFGSSRTWVHDFSLFLTLLKFYN